MQVTPTLRRLFLAAAALALVPSPASATVMIPLSIEDMSLRATAVVRGRVLSSEAKWDDQHQRIYTFTQLEVLDPIYAAGQLPKTIVIRTLGGEVGKIGMKVAGTERFTLNEEVLVFLSTDRASTNGGFQVVGMSQGKFHIEHEAKGRAVAIPDISGLAFARPDSSGTMKVDAETPLPDRIPLVELTNRIRAAIEKRATPAQPQSPSQPQAPAQPAQPANPGVPPATTR